VHSWSDESSEDELLFSSQNSYKKKDTKKEVPIVLSDEFLSPPPLTQIEFQNDQSPTFEIKAQEKEAVPQASKMWICRICTYQNENMGFLTCQICGGERYKE